MRLLPPVEADPITEEDHPAEYSAEVLVAIDRVLGDYLPPVDMTARRRIVDTYAGKGSGVDRWSAAGYHAVGLELEPEWAIASPLVVVADVLEPPFRNEAFDAVVCSPCYGNRMADHHEATDDSTRITYTHKLGRLPSSGSAAILQWGNEYRTHHEDAARSWFHLLPPGEDGLIVVNMKNHVRADVEQLVTEWWVNMLLVAGCRLLEVVRVPTPGMGFGANGDKRTECEFLIVVRPPATRRLF